MVQFKHWFSDPTMSTDARATTVQRCIRAGGKHNDLENVGQTARHHTFFEMLGNFSFGPAGVGDGAGATAAMKEEAIVNAWDFLTKRLGLPADRLRVTVHEDDDEAAAVWLNVIGIPAEHMVAGREDNWWTMGGNDGPCGPCTEIFWDQQVEVDGEQWLEIWNLVFMQYCQTVVEGKDTLKRLPQPCVDTGMGLERLASLMQGVPTNYHTDGFLGLFEALAKETQSPAPAETIAFWQSGDEAEAVAARVIVDHCRAVAFLLCDGVLPSNSGRGYVLRRLIRRALYHGQSLGPHVAGRPFLTALCPELAAPAGTYRAGTDSWELLRQRWPTVGSVVRQEELLFLRTMDEGLKILRAELDAVKRSETKDCKLSAATVFKLQDTFGLPMDLTAAIASGQTPPAWDDPSCGVSCNPVEIDFCGAEALMAEQRSRGRAATAARLGGVAGGDATPKAVVKGFREWADQGLAPEFVGYDSSARLGRGMTVEVSGVIEVTGKDCGCWVVVDPCPFYPEGGGQLGDTGTLVPAGSCEQSESAALDPVLVDATIRPYDSGIACWVPGPRPEWLQPRCSLTAAVDRQHRDGCAAHHTATHLLGAALRRLVSELSPIEDPITIVQAGSVVRPDRLRFDFSGWPGKLSSDQLASVSAWVNTAILADLPVQCRETPLADALSAGVTADFGERYGTVVRLVECGNDSNEHHSAELCGGTHVESTGQIGPFHILRESGVAAGIRRVEATVGRAAYDYHAKRSSELADISETLKLRPNDSATGRIRRLLQEHKSFRKELGVAQSRLSQVTAGAAAAAASSAPIAGEHPASQGADSNDSVFDWTGMVGSVQYLPTDHLAGGKSEAAALRAQANWLAASCTEQEHQAPSASKSSASARPALFVVVGKSNICVAAAETSNQQPDAAALLNAILGAVGGRGGGTATFAQGALDVGSEKQCEDTSAFTRVRRWLVSE